MEQFRGIEFDASSTTHAVEVSESISDLVQLASMCDAITYSKVEKVYFVFLAVFNC